MPSWCKNALIQREHVCRINLESLPLVLPRRRPLYLSQRSHSRTPERPLSSCVRCTTIWQEELADLASKICTQEVGNYMAHA